MRADAFLLVGLFLGLVTVPFLPGVLVHKKRLDTTPLLIENENSKTGRYFGVQFRAHLRSLPNEEDLTREIRISANDPARALILAGEIHAAPGTRLNDAYVRGSVLLDRAVVAKRIAADGNVVLEEGCKIIEWVDTENELLAKNGSHLGRAASAAKRLTLNEGCTFIKLWGMPVWAQRDVQLKPTLREPITRSELSDSVFWAIDTTSMRRGRAKLALPSGIRVQRDLVVQGDLETSPDCLINGTIKCHGVLTLGEGTVVKGDVIARKGVSLAAGVRIRGHIFAEGDISVGPNCQVGTRAKYKTVYSVGRITLAPGATVYGLLIAEKGGAAVAK